MSAKHENKIILKVKRFGEYKQYIPIACILLMENKLIEIINFKSIIMAGCLSSLLFFGSVLVIIIIDIRCWIESWMAGISGLLGLIGFLVGYIFSVEMSISPRDFWVNPEFGILMKKLRYAWITGLSTGLISLMIIGSIYQAVTAMR